MKVSEWMCVGDTEEDKYEDTRMEKCVHVRECIFTFLYVFDW